MKRKNLISITLLFLYVVLFVGLWASSYVTIDGALTNDSTYVDQQDNRIKVIEQTIVSGHRVTIIEVDGAEYLTHDTGGFIRLDLNK